MGKKLLNSCKYSFHDLLYAVYKDYDPNHIKILYSLSQNERNLEVKRLCKIAGWYYQDVIGSDKIIYTAFSPHIQNHKY